MKIFVVGDFSSFVHAKSFYDSFKESGYDVGFLDFAEYFSNSVSRYYGGVKRNFSLGIYNYLQNKFLLGSAINEINKDICLQAESFDADMVFIYRGVFVWSETIETLREQGAVVFGYNNDDPFGKSMPRYYWRHYLKAVPFYDHIYVYRKTNEKATYDIGAKSVSVLKSYYNKLYNFPGKIYDKYKTDILFAGHFENDGRDIIIRNLLQEGFSLKLFGSFWHKSKLYKDILEYFDGKNIDYLYAEEYNKALKSAKIALVFLSKLNNDTYTRRCFEIPATKTFMLCEYSDELASMYKEGEEAEYFRNYDELAEKLKFYLANEDKRNAIAVNGYNRLLKNKDEIADRTAALINMYNKVKNNEKTA